MTHLLRFAIIASTVMLVLSGCDKTHSAEDDHDHSETAARSTDGHDNDADHDTDSHDDHDHDAEPHDDHDDDADHQPGEDDQHTDESETEGIIVLDEHELTEFGIRMAIAEPGVLRNTTSLVGEIVFNPNRIAHVVSRASGISVEVRCTIGDLVEAGETLAVLESAELAESKAKYLFKAAQAALAATDLARAETIYANTIRLLEIIKDNPDVDSLRSQISELDIGAARGNLIMAYAQMQSAEAVYDREKTLFERQISSESEYLNAGSELKKAFAMFQAERDDLAFANRRELDIAKRAKSVADVSQQAAERRLHAFGLDEDGVKLVESESDIELARYVIHTPIAGRIIERHLVRGESLGAGDQVFVVADLSSVWGQLTLYQRDLAVVREGQTVRVFGTHGHTVADVTIEYVSPILDERTRTTTARVVLDNTEGDWRPGMFVRAEVVGAEHAGAVVVPRSALQDIDNTMVIFVETTAGLERRDVRVGQGDADSVEIVSGLRLGERYVASGGLALKVELNKAALEHAGHAH